MDGPTVSRVFSLAEDGDAAVHAAAGALRAGELVVLPTDTVYGLAADAFNTAATAQVFELKKRPRTLPLPVLVSRPKQAWALASTVPPAAPSLAAAFWPGALTMILPQTADLSWDLGDAPGTIAVRMPQHPAVLQLLEMVGPLAVTSANLSGEPTPPTVPEIKDRLGDTVAVYLDGGDSPGDTGSTIVDLTAGAPVIRREGPISADEIRRAIVEG